MPKDNLCAARPVIYNDQCGRLPHTTSYFYFLKTQPGYLSPSLSVVIKRSSNKLTFEIY